MVDLGRTSVGAWSLLVGGCCGLVAGFGSSASVAV
nr:MAG TPA: Homocysteine S-methyltransferase [Caudoviricetes sp.]